MEINLKPLKLELRGFTGVFSAFGRDSLVLDLQTIPNDAQLVALVGPNGAGKSTIMDNLHPYRVMPSRSSTLGPGGFSYWDNINSPTAYKELLWDHAGEKYRSVLSFKVSGKSQKADSYLYQWDEHQQDWKPVHLDDGTLSDGKNSTYDRCVDAILGPPERFFTSQFSAQKRKSIASYGAGDIKSILASVLNLQHYRELSSNAGLVGKLLRQQLEGLNDELAEARSQDSIAATVADELTRMETVLEGFAAEEREAVRKLDTARINLSALVAKQEAQAKDVEQFAFLTEQINAAGEKAATASAAVHDQSSRERNTRRAEVSASQIQLVAAKRILQEAQSESARLQGVLAEKGKIAEAVESLPSLQERVDAIDAEILKLQSGLEGAPAKRQELQRLVGEQARLKSEGSAKTIAIQNLTDTAALIDEVPCKGSEFQSACKLLGQANGAATIIPQHQAELAEKRAAYSAVTQAIGALQVILAEFDAVESKVRELQASRRPIASAIDSNTKVSAKAPLIVDAEERLPQLAENISQQRQMIDAADARISEANAAIGQIDGHSERALADIAKSLESDTKVLKERRDALEKPVTMAEIETARAGVNQVASDLAVTRVKGSTINEQKVSLLGRLEALRTLAARSEQVKAQAGRLNDEIAKWRLLEKGLGNDGCVALSIDDAGPEIAAICNSLLADCFEGRFIVRLDTQTTTQAGNLKETFDVKVFDGHRGTEKSLGDMSGGEEVLVNECLTRSIALYASQSSPTHCQTLFTDETDGALDVAAKRTFMRMKRSVLKQGGYEREFFITHTPELWALADHRIDVVDL